MGGGDGVGGSPDIGIVGGGGGGFKVVFVSFSLTWSSLE
jgi:hypothetical protein